MEAKTRRTSLAVTVALVGLNIAAFQLLLSGWSTARVDLTADRLFSITPATKRLLGNLEEDLTIYGYFSKKTHPKLAPLVPEISDLIDEYRAISRGKVHAEIVDPGEDEAAEREANDRFGVRSTPFRLASKYEAGIVNAYFALVVKYGDQYVRYGFEDLIEVEPLPDGDIEVRLKNLEYDLTRGIKKVVYGFRSTAELFERIDAPVRFTAVMTPGRLPEVFSEAPEAVRSAAEELKERGGDKFVFEEIDPSGDAALEDEVYRRFGARPMSLGLFSDTSFHLHGVLEVGDRMENVILTGESVSAASVREAIESSLRRQTPGFLKTVGVVSPSPSIPPELMMQLRMQGQAPPEDEFEQIRRFLEQDYRIARVDLGAESGVASEVDVLVVLEPTALDEREVYNLDQYLMRGGRLVLCAGNYRVNFDSSGLRVDPHTTGLDDWLAHLGIEIPNTLVLDDRNQPLPIPEVRQTPLGLLRTWSLAPYPYLVEVRDDGLPNTDVTGRLDAVGIYWGSPLNVDREKTGENVEVIELLRSSDLSWTSDDLSAVGYVDYAVPAEGTKPHVLAVALSGKLRSYFADREPPGSGPGDDEDGAEQAPTEVPLEESPDTRVVVIGNAAFLSDLVAGFLGGPEGGFFTENLRFMENLIDWTVLDNDLVGIRSRGTAARRLARTDKAQEVALETANYLAPTVLLLALAGYRAWKRRNTAPIVAATSGAAAAEPAPRAEG